MNKMKIIITDGWHPTINPSSRMPIYYHRYLDFFGNTEGILNELPRPYGGNTLRAMKIGSDGNLTITDLNKPIKYVPWWLPANSQSAIDLLSNTIHKALNNKNCVENFTYRRYFDEYLHHLKDNQPKTFGEAINEINFKLYKEIYPELPEIKLVSIAKSKALPILTEAFDHIITRLLDILNNICYQNSKTEFGLLGFISYYQDQSWRISYRPNRHLCTLVSNGKPHIFQEVNTHSLLELFSEGKLIPGSMLLAILELSLVDMGFKVVHFGNTYGHLDMVARASKLKNLVYTWEDNTDSWNYAYLADANGIQYPIHLLEMIKYGKNITPFLSAIIKESLIKKCPVIINTKKGGDLIDALSDRRT